MPGDDRGRVPEGLVKEADRVGAAETELRSALTLIRHTEDHDARIRTMLLMRAQAACRAAEAALEAALVAIEAGR